MVTVDFETQHKRALFAKTPPAFGHDCRQLFGFDSGWKNLVSILTGFDTIDT